MAAKKRKPKDLEPISLDPLSLPEALRAAMKAPPMPSPRKTKKKPKKG